VLVAIVLLFRKGLAPALVQGAAHLARIGTQTTARFRGR
jgi:hypothetical protein